MGGVDTVVRKTVTVVFTDVAGFTSLGERLDPEALRAVMTRYFDEMSSILQRHGGTVEKFIGDAVMAVFGVPAVHEDDALRAVRAASDMREALRRLNKELERDFGVTIAARIGVNTGEVVAGRADPGSGRALVTGDAVNVAARLEQAAEPGDILIGDGTHQLVRAAVEAEPVDSLTLRGKSDSLRAHRVLLVHPTARGVAGRLDSPMVGRDQELRQVREAFRSAVAECSCRLVTILASAGVGKSRLVEEVVAGLRGEATVLQGRCLSYGEGITYWPVVEIVGQAAGIDGDTPDVARAKIAGLLEADPEADVVTRRLTDVLGVTEGAGTVQEISWAIRRLLEAVAGGGPLVVAVDDIHWAEPALLDLIEHVAERSRDAPILVLCTARPELLDVRPGWGEGNANATAIHLGALTNDQSGELIANLVDRVELPAAARDRITEAAGGNPLFVEQILATLIDRGLLRLEDGRWSLSGNLDRLSVPPTVQALLSARLDRLEPGHRAVLERAAVEGGVFHAEAVTALLPGAAGQPVSRRLRSLVRKELIEPDGSPIGGGKAYRFRHQLIRDAVYEAVPKATRAQLHRGFARWLEGRAGDRAPEYAEFIGYHLEQAVKYRRELGPPGDPERADARRAGDLLGAAGRRATDRGDLRAGAKLLGRAAALLPSPDPVRVVILIDQGVCLMDAGEMHESERVLQEARREAQALGRDDLEVRAELGLWSVFTHTFPPGFDYQDLQHLGRRAVEILTPRGDDEGLAWAWFGVTNSLWGPAKWDSMREPLRRAADHARRAGNRSMELRALRFLVASAYNGHATVEEACRFAQGVLGEVGDSWETQGWVRRYLGHLLVLDGRYGEAEEHLNRARTIFTELGSTASLAALSFATGALAHARGDDAGAARELRSAVESLQAMGERGWLTNLSADLASELVDLDQIEEAERYATLSRDSAHPGDASGQTWWRIAMARVLARRERPEDGVLLAREAVAQARGTEEVLSLARALVALADVLVVAGERKEPATAIREAIQIFERKGARVEARQGGEHLTSVLAG
jgi:class 3 adenylate cyclase/tetratricopeptide (TPR) repeat protein